MDKYKHIIKMIKGYDLKLVKTSPDIYIFKKDGEGGENLCLTFLPIGINILTGCYGTISWQRKYGEYDRYFPQIEEDDFYYWVKKINIFGDIMVLKNKDGSYKKNLIHYFYLIDRLIKIIKEKEGTND